jgi:hypothetical protein
VPVPHVDSEAHRVRLAVPGAAVASERRAVPQVESGPVARCESSSVRALALVFEPLVAPQGEPELVGPCGPQGERALAVVFEPRVVPRCELALAAEFLRLVVPPVARWAPRRGLRPQVVRALLLQRHVAVLREYAPQDWAVRQAAFERGSAELARLAAVVSPAAGFVRPERLRGAALARDRQWAAGAPLPVSADGHGSPPQIEHGSLRPGAYVEPAPEPALCAAHAALPVRQVWAEH